MRCAAVRIGARWEQDAASFSRFMGTPVWIFLCKVRMIGRPSGGIRLGCLEGRGFCDRWLKS